MSPKGLQKDDRHTFDLQGYQLTSGEKSLGKPKANVPLKPAEWMGTTAKGEITDSDQFLPSVHAGSLFA
jgi:hypothetical protein